MEEKETVCHECGTIIGNWADVCIECGCPKDEDGERLSEENVRAEAEVRFIRNKDDENSNEYEIVDIEYYVNGTELEIIAYLNKISEGEGREGEGDDFYLYMLDSHSGEISYGPVTMPYMEVGATNDVWIKGRIDQMGTYRILVELQ
ncbi:MAG: hypothetical protein J6S23_05425 [Clostridia bacterium]|nr:hypothetical protein [Clostridia bacterium]